MKKNIRYGEYTGSAVWKPFYKFFSFLAAIISDFFYDVSVKLNKVFHKKQKVTNIKTKRRNQKIFLLQMAVNTKTIIDEKKLF